MPAKAIARGTDELVTATPETTAAELGQTMAERDVGSVVIVTEGDPVGIVTDRDLALKVLTAGLDPDTPASTFMTRELITAHEDAGLTVLCEKMKRGTVRRIPIVDDEGKLSGIVTLDDMVVLLEGEMEDLTAVIKSESPPY